MAASALAMPRCTTGIGADRATIEIRVPKPPSQNRLWRVGRNRKTGKRLIYRDKKYLKWINDLWACWLLQRPAGFRAIAAPFRIMIATDAKRRIDIDNVPKAVLDGLQRCGVIVTDALCEAVVSERQPGLGGECWIKISIEPTQNGA